MGSSILIYFPCISKSITFPLQVGLSSWPLEIKMTISIFQALVQKLIDRGHEVAKMAVKMSNFCGEKEIHDKLNNICL